MTEGDDGKFIGMGEMDDEGRVAPRRLVVDVTAIALYLAIEAPAVETSPAA